MAPRSFIVPLNRGRLSAPRDTQPTTARNNRNTAIPPFILRKLKQQLQKITPSKERPEKKPRHKRSLKRQKLAATTSCPRVLLQWPWWKPTQLLIDHCCIHTHFEAELLLLRLRVPAANEMRKCNTNIYENWKLKWMDQEVKKYYYYYYYYYYNNTVSTTGATTL